MKKIVLILLLIFPFRLCLAENLNLSAPSGVLIEATTGKVLFEKEKDKQMSMASMTKIMSMLLIMEQIDKGNISYDDEVIISDTASKMGGSQIYLQTGEKYKVRDLLKSIAMASANDSVVAMAEKTFGSVEAFVEAMNKKATELKLKNTHFVNVHGLDEEEHYSSAYDMAIMAKELLKHENILNYTSLYEEYFTKNDGSQIWLVNTNKLVKFYEGVDGLKTGYTVNAGYCLTATAKKKNFRLISVVMGEEDIETRSSDTVKLLNYGFNAYKVNVIKKQSEVLGQVKVIKGKKSTVDIVLTNDAIELLSINDNVSKYNYKLSIDDVKAPVKKGDVVGYVEITDEKGNLVNKVSITVKEDVLKANFWDMLKNNFKSVLLFS